MLRNSFSIGVLVLAHFGSATQAQVPHVYGSWKLDTEASEFPGAMPQSQVRTYLPGEDGYLIGIAITVDAQGNAGFLQFAAKTDGQDYPEYGVGSLAALQISGTRTSSTYAESQVDERTVEWVDKTDGEPYVMGTRSVSADGTTLTIEAHVPAEPDNSFTLVYDKQ